MVFFLRHFHNFTSEFCISIRAAKKEEDKTPINTNNVEYRYKYVILMDFSHATIFMQQREVGR